MYQYPYTAKQIVTTAYNHIFQTGIYNDYCKDWRSKPEEDKTWNEFKIFFTKANQNLRKSRVTSQTAGYQENNLCQLCVEDSPSEVQALEAIANLATASAENRQTITKLTETNASLVKELVELQKEIASLKSSTSTTSPIKLNTHYY